jgi:HrpA-like RNA helicase
MSDTFNLLLTQVERKKLKFVKDDFKLKIYEVVNDFFPSLNKEDLKVLQILTTFTVDIISFNYDFNSLDDTYQKQWMQNNNQDIKGVILLLLPFIDDKNNSFLLKKIKDLNHLLYAYGGNNIPGHILDLEREKIKSSYFEYGNMGIGLIKPAAILKVGGKENLLELYDKTGNEKLIYTTIHHNFMGLLQTLEIINGKTYINWVNISPINLSEYSKSTIFKRTVSKLDDLLNGLKSNITNDKTIGSFLSKNLIDYGGLWFGDIYNILRTRFYEDAKTIKWLIFAYETSDTNKIYLIQGLNKMFDINKILNSQFNSWEDMSVLEQLNFENKIVGTLDNLNKNQNINGKINLDYEILKYTFIYLFSNYSDSRAINNKVSNKFVLNSEQTVQDEEDDFTKKDLEQIKEISNQDILNCLEYIIKNHLKHLWTFLKEYLNKFEGSAYGKFLILRDNKGKSISDTYYYWKPNDTIDITKMNNIKDRLNLKNIYNIAKSLSHNVVKSPGATSKNKDEWTLNDKNYISFNNENKLKFFNRINNLENKNNWINLKGNFKRQFIDYSSGTYDRFIDNILSGFSQGYIYLIFEELIYTGILNKFTPNLNITDKQTLPQDTRAMKSQRNQLIKDLFTNNKQWLESYYYLTNQQFKYLGKMRLDKSKISNPNNKYDEMIYFDIIPKDHEWPVFYAMDWISQLSFFQHYIFHQVMYVTGATGQGKSTQVPKLLLYAMKCIDYKSDGKVICTQPRVPPTIGNATRISEELGVPIELTINTSTIKMKTDNFYVQFKHQKEAHVSSLENFNSLKIVTDGTLLAELQSNPTLKKNFNNKLINSNVYDIVIVDEAHEHNTNMDIIIALSKQACYVNNQVRLIVVSATMDDDEPIYRRYFYNINDKLLFPIKYPIAHPFLASIDFLPLPKFMDRRYHISPPGATTQYRVDEFYLEFEPIVQNPDNSINEQKTAENAQTLGYEKIIEICNKSISGEILFFANGKGEIIKAVKYLNSVLPPGDIALPYFAEMNETYKNIISKINLKITTIRNKREKIHEEWGVDFIEDLSVPLGVYRRSIIIATNVAEASVTIPNLVYVVDNGYAKVNAFKPELSISKLGVEKISESSRVQRRGRVGRIGDGTVYYMYRKDSRKFIKPKYKITQDDVKLTFLKLLGMKEFEKINVPNKEYYNKLIVSKLNNPNIFKTYGTEPDKTHYTQTSGLNNIIIQNYYINNEKPAFIYFIDKEDYFIDKENNENNFMLSEFFMLNDGQIFENVLDMDGSFYLIHPFENSIKRNILNNIIEYNKKPSNSIKPSAFKFILNSLQSQSLIVDANKHLYNTPANIITPNFLFVKSELGAQIGGLELSISDAITLISASAMGCLTEVYEIKIFIEVIGSLGSLVNPTCTWKKFKEIYGNIKSDLIFAHNLINKLKKNFSDLFVFNIYTPHFESLLKQHYQSINYKFKKLLSQNIIEAPADYDVNLWNKLIKLKNAGNLEKDIGTVLRTDKSPLQIISDNIEKNREKIIEWANRHYFNGELLINFINKLGEYYMEMSIINNNPVLEWAKNFNSNFSKYLNEYTIDEKIIRSFLFGKQYQFTFRHNHNINLMQTIMNYDIFIANITKNRFGEEESLVTSPSNFYFYYNYLEDEKIMAETKQAGIKVSWISHINPEWLVPTFPLFFNPTFNDVIMRFYSNDDSTIEFLNSQTFKKISKQIANNWNQSSNIWDDEKTPILREFYRSVTKIISYGKT